MTTLEKIQEKLQSIRLISKKKDVVTWKDLDDEGILIMLNLIEYLKTTRYTTFALGRTAKALNVDWTGISDSFHLLVNDGVLVFFKEEQYNVGVCKIYKLDKAKLESYFGEIDGAISKLSPEQKLRRTMDNMGEIVKEAQESLMDKIQRHRCQS